MRTMLRSKVTLLFLALAVVLAIPAIAFADVVSNNLDNTVDASAETVNMATGDQAKQVTFRVIPQDKSVDGNQGCNFDGVNSTLTVNVTSSNASVATVGTSSLTFTD